MGYLLWAEIWDFDNIGRVKSCFVSFICNDYDFVFLYRTWFINFLTVEVDITCWKSKDCTKHFSKMQGKHKAFSKVIKEMVNANKALHFRQNTDATYTFRLKNHILHYWISRSRKLTLFVIFQGMHVKVSEFYWSPIYYYLSLHEWRKGCPED